MSGPNQDNREQKDTPWRQGHLLPTACHDALGLSASERYVVVSHDCDLASAEPYVEVIRANCLPAADGSLRGGENPRALHLVGEHAGRELVLELAQTEKLTIEKSSLFAHLPDECWTLLPKTRALLQSWLACRYARHALPNELNDRLKRGLKKLTAAAKTRTESILAVFISFDPNEELKSLDDPYEVELAVVYDSAHQDGLRHANELVDKFKDALDDIDGVEYDDTKVRPWSDTQFTLRDMVRMVQFRLDFLSYRGETIGKTVGQ